MQHTITFISGDEVARLIDFPRVIDAVEEAYVWKAQGRTADFPLVFHEFEPGVADMDIKSGHVQPAGAFGLKLISFFEENSARSIAPLTSFVALFDDETGLPTAVMNAAAITGYRTGAAGALGIKHLARPDSETLLIVGCGHLCAYQAAATLLAMPSIRRIIVHDPMNAAKAETKAAGLLDEVAALGITVPTGVVACAQSDLQRAVGESDVVITITPSREAFIMADWVKPGTHFSCVGADMAGKQEIDAAIVAQARVLCDDIAQSTSVGELEMGIKGGAFGSDAIAGEIGQVIDGQIPGRENNHQITVFDSTGIAPQDITVAAQVLAAAREQGVSTTVTW